MNQTVTQAEESRLRETPEPLRTEQDIGSGAEPQHPKASDHVAALCERLQKLAEAASEESLRAKQQEAETVIAEARKKAEAESHAELARTRQKLQRQIERELQNARLEGRASIHRFRWSLLDQVLDEATRRVLRLRESAPARYVAALRRFFDSARQQLASNHLVVKANPRDIRLLGANFTSPVNSAPDCRTELVEAELQAGLIVGTPEGSIVSDWTVRERRRRLELELRLAAAQILFEEIARP